jgi:hypothetical protein
MQKADFVWAVLCEEDQEGVTGAGRCDSTVANEKYQVICRNFGGTMFENAAC